MDTIARTGDNTGGMTDAEQIAANLKEKHEALVKRATDLTETLARLPAVAEDLDTADRLSETVRQCTTFLKASDSTRVEEKEPYLTGERAVDGFFKGIEAGVKKTKEQAERVRSQYDIAVENRERARREEEARKAREIARKAQEEADALAAKARTKRQQELAQQAQEAAAQAHQGAEEAHQDTKVTSPDLTRTRTGSGVTTSLRTEWRFEIEDPKAVPKKFLVPSEALIKGAVKAATTKDGECPLSIPGVRIYKHRFSQVR